MPITRRQMLKISGTAAMALSSPAILRAQGKSRVVIVGGGAGGATAARQIALLGKGAIDVVLVEANERYYSCFGSDIYLGGFRDFEALGHGYAALSQNYGIQLVHDMADKVDNAKAEVTLASGSVLAYDKLVLSPGIDFIYDSVPGYSPEAQSKIPIAWKFGSDVPILKEKVLSMKAGGTFILVPPPDPARCPVAPYERASMVARLLKLSNPTAKIVILDPKEKFSMQGLFQEAWETYYPGMIEWIGADIHGGVSHVDVDKLEFETDFDTFHADAACIVPAQRAGSIVHAAGVADGDWAPILPLSMASLADPKIHVMGDACDAGDMPKSGSAANSQAKVAAAAIVAELTGAPLPDPTFTSTCWSAIRAGEAIKTGGTYRAGESRIEATDHVVSQAGEDAAIRLGNFATLYDWYDGMIADMFS